MLLTRDRKTSDVPPPAPPRVLTPVVAVFAVLAVAAAAYFGWAWYQSSRPAAVAAVQRDEALRDAVQIAINLRTMSSNSVQADLQRWEDSATGPLLQDFRQQHATLVTTFQQAKVTDTATVKHDALTQFDPTAGTAKAILAVDVVVTPDGGKPTTKRELDQIQLQRTPEGWKANAAGPVTGQS